MINHLVELPPLHGHLLHDVLAVEDRLQVEPRLLTPQPSIQYVLNSPSLSQSEKWSGNAKVLVNGGVPALRWACPPTPSSPPRRAWCRPSCASSALSRCGRPASPDVDVHNVIISIEFWWINTWMSSTPLRIDTPDSLYGSQANLTCALLIRRSSRVYLNFKKFSKSHFLLIYFVPACVYI